MAKFLVPFSRLNVNRIVRLEISPGWQAIQVRRPFVTGSGPMSPVNHLLVRLFHKEPAYVIFSLMWFRLALQWLKLEPHLARGCIVIAVEKLREHGGAECFEYGLHAALATDAVVEINDSADSPQSSFIELLSSWTELVRYAKMVDNQISCFITVNKFQCVFTTQDVFNLLPLVHLAQMFVESCLCNLGVKNVLHVMQHYQTLPRPLNATLH
mmetsp:Transcript_80094/g.141811  ORF Transcript_80094/g.141811 Transcript_80094/m.141811 type:complete len:212 (-) Transcript_80094:771-1406(-)